VISESRIPNPESRAWLLWIERTLLCLGAATAAWCAAVWLEGQYTQRRPIGNPIAIAEQLPGDEGTPRALATSRRSIANGTVVARLDAPSVQLSTAVLEGSDDAILNRGAGHIEFTAFPGQRGNIGIAGHRDTIFRPLRRMRVGDTLALSTSDRVYHYRISNTLIVNPDDVHVLNPTRQPTLTLVTCYPFDFVGHAPRRFIVQAALVGEEERDARNEQGR
jgi:sortase A